MIHCRGKNYFESRSFLNASGRQFFFVIPFSVRKVIRDEDFLVISKAQMQRDFGTVTAISNVGASREVDVEPTKIVDLKILGKNYSLLSSSSRSFDHNRTILNEWAT